MDWNTVLWSAQIIIAAMLLVAGVPKLARSREQLLQSMAWIEDYPDSTVTLIGVVEIVGGLGLVLPGLLNTLEWLTPIAAIGVALLMAGATVINLQRGDRREGLITFVVLLVAVAIAAGRLFVVTA
jgi:uncharacterized membrane protein YphA (DoxX/SURF4 family)